MQGEASTPSHRDQLPGRAQSQGPLHAREAPSRRRRPANATSASGPRSGGLLGGPGRQWWRPCSSGRRKIARHRAAPLVLGESGVQREAIASPYKDGVQNQKAAAARSRHAPALARLSGERRAEKGGLPAEETYFANEVSEPRGAYVHRSFARQVRPAHPVFASVSTRRSLGRAHRRPRAGRFAGAARARAEAVPGTRPRSSSRSEFDVAQVREYVGEHVCTASGGRRLGSADGAPAAEG